jgi:O-antigen/teichoic acid export membrane protein
MNAVEAVNQPSLPRHLVGRRGGSALPAGGASASRIMRNGTFSLVTQVLQTVLNLAVFAILARALGKELFGEYVTFWTLIMVVQLVVEAGMTTLLTCKIVQAPERWQEVVGEAADLCVAVTLASAGVFLVLGAGWVCLARDWAVFPCCVAAGLACSVIQVQRFSTGVFRAFDRFDEENLARLGQSLLYTLLVVALVELRVAGVSSVLVMLAVSFVVADAFLLVRLKRFGRFTWRFSPALAWKWIREAFPLGVGDIVRGPFWQIDLLLLGLLQPLAVVGIYSVGSRPLLPLYWLPRSVLTAAFPSLARMAGKPEQLLQKVSNSIRLLWVISLPLAAGSAICADSIVYILGGQEYSEAALLLAILMWKVPLVFGAMPLRYLFTAVGQQHAYGRLVIAAFFLELLASLALIPWLGYFGACISTLLAELVFTVAGLVLCRQTVGALDYRPLGAALLAVGAMGAVLAAARWSVQSPLALLPLLVVATLVYLAVCLLLGALRWEEVRPLARRLTGHWPVRSSIPSRLDG